MEKSQIGFEEMEALAELARKNGTEDAWIEVALVWMREADSEIKTLRKCETMTLWEIVEVIMTQHWDMAACPCWICKAGRESGCRPRPKYQEGLWKDLSRVDIETT